MKTGNSSDEVAGSINELNYTKSIPHGRPWSPILCGFPVVEQIMFLGNVTEYLFEVNFKLLGLKTWMIILVIIILSTF